MSLKILNIVPSYYPAKIYGGVIFSSHNANLEFSKKYKNIKIRVLTTTANGTNRLAQKSFSKNFHKNYNVDYYFDEIINRFSLRLLLNLKKNIQNSDIIHFQDIFSIFSIVGIVISNFYKKKILISPRGVLSEWALNSKKKILKKILLLIFFKKKNLNWHVTSIMEKKDLNLLGIYKNIFIVPNLIKKSKYKSKKNLLRKKNDFYIGCLSRFDKKKGMDYLVKSLPLLEKRFKLILAGPDFGFKKEITKLIENLGLKNRVILFDFLDFKKKEMFFNTIDLFALPSLNENFGNVFLESLLRGKPILTSYNTPFTDVEKKGCGVVAKLNKKNISFKIAKIQKTNNLILKKNSLSYAKKFNQNNILKFYKNMYDQICK